MVSTLVIYYIFLIYANGSLILSSFTMLLYWFYNYLESVGQTYNSSYNNESLLVSINYMIIVTCLKTAAVFYHWVYFISSMTSSTPPILFFLSNPLIFPIFFIPLIIFILCFPTFGIRKYNIIVLMYLKGLNVGHRL